MDDLSTTAPFAPNRLIRIQGILHSINSKLLLVAAIGVLTSIGLLCVGYLSIEALILIWNLAFVGSVIMWEKNKRDNSVGSFATFSDDERWSKIKRDLERVEQKLAKTKDAGKKKSLLYQKNWLENELRRVEWSIKEKNMSEIYNLRMGNLPKLGTNQADPKTRTDSAEISEDSQDFDPSDKYTPDGALRERKRLERLAEENKNLERIIENAEKILGSEPVDSLSIALQSVVNDFKAHYNVIKKRKNNSETLANYWVAWALISSVINHVDIDPQISKYASKEFRPKIAKLIKMILSLDLSLDTANSVHLGDQNLKSELDDNYSEGPFGSDSEGRRVGD
jgi:hypothetical protein